MVSQEKILLNWWNILHNLSLHRSSVVSETKNREHNFYRCLLSAHMASNTCICFLCYKWPLFFLCLIEQLWPIEEEQMKGKSVLPASIFCSSRLNYFNTNIFWSIFLFLIICLYVLFFFNHIFKIIFYFNIPTQLFSLPS